MKNGKKWYLVIAFALSVVLAGCGKGENDPDGNHTQAEADEADAEVTETRLLQLGDYKGIQVPAMETEPTEEEIQQEIDAILEENSYLVELEGKTVIEEGDVVNIDYRGLIDGEPFEGGTSSEGGYDLPIGSGWFIDGFEDQLIGKELGKFYELDLVFPESYKNKELAGKPVVFEVTVNKIQEKIVPELTDAFVQENLEYDSVEALKAGLLEELRSMKLANAQNQKNYDVMTAVIEASVFEVSQEQIEAEKEQIIISNESAAASYGVDLETYLYFFMNGMSVEEFEEQCAITAELRIKAALVVWAVAEAEAITVSEEEYTEEAEALMGNYGFSSVEEFEEAYTKDAIQENIVYNKTLEFLVEQAIEV